ncbi:MAG: hypothetical protein ACRYGF_04930 [Janthinobacterium lividum]
MSTNRLASFEDRVNYNRIQANAPMQCSCGSTHFFQISVQEYSNRGYGMAQLQSLSMQPGGGYICVCGLPVALNDTATGKAAEGGRGRFLRSVEVAIEKRNSLTPQALAKGFVSLAEHQELLARSEALQETVDAITEHLEADDEDEEESAEEPAKEDAEQTEPKPAAVKTAAKKSAAKKAAKLWQRNQSFVIRYAM